MIVIEHGPGGMPAMFDAPRATIRADTADEVAPALQAMAQARDEGLWLAGYASYELGYALEPRLAPLMPEDRPGPLLHFTAHAGPRPADDVLARAEAEAGESRLGTARLDWDARAYARAFSRVRDYIAAGDCYQVNLTFPMRTEWGGSTLGLFGALRRRQPVRYGACVALEGAPVILSRSPELFFRLAADRRIETRPMKGTTPRDPDPARDAALRTALAASTKDRAENLMIVDLLRNDIGRLCETGTVRVPELFTVESYATVHQMVSAIEGRLRTGVTPGGVFGALFPCGSVTGAPKIRAMEIIRELEPLPRGAYCGAIGWFGPDGSAAFSVAIRTLTLWEGGAAVFNVGGGVVHDSTAAGEYEEALWKARFAQIA